MKGRITSQPKPETAQDGSIAAVLEPVSETEVVNEIAPEAAPEFDPASTPAKGIQTQANKEPRRRQRTAQTNSVRHFAATHFDDHGVNRQAELFYLQKQIQLQTQMVIILEDGQRVQGVIEWYDRHCVKVRGKLRMLIYKTAIKYLYKAGEVGSSPGE